MPFFDKNREYNDNKFFSKQEQYRQLIEKFNNSIPRVSEQSFTSVYGEETIIRDLARVAELKALFKGSHTEVPELAEIFTVQQIELMELCGANSFASRTAEFDDIVNGIDGYVLIETDSREIQGIAFDVTISAESLRTKLLHLRRSIESNLPFAKLKYVVDAQEHPLPQVPDLLKMVLYFNRSEMEQFYEQYQSRASSVIDHEFNAVLYGELVLLADTIETFHTQRQEHNKARVSHLSQHLRTSRADVLRSLRDIESMRTRSFLEFAEVLSEVFGIGLLVPDYFDFTTPDISSVQTPQSQEILLPSPSRPTDRSPVWKTAGVAAAQHHMVWQTFISIARSLEDIRPGSIRKRTDGVTEYSDALIQQVVQTYEGNKKGLEFIQELKDQGFISVGAMCDVVRATEQTLQPIIDQYPTLSCKVSYALNKHGVYLSPELQEILIQTFGNIIPDDWYNSASLEQERDLKRAFHLTEKLKAIVDRLVAQTHQPRTMFERELRKKGLPSTYFSPEVVAVLNREHPHIPDTYKSSREFESIYAGSRKTIAILLEQVADALPSSQRIVRENADGRGNSAMYYGPDVQERAKEILPPKHWVTVGDISQQLNLNPKTIVKFLTQQANNNRDYVRDLGTGLRPNRFWNPTFVTSVFPEYKTDETL